MKKFGFRLVALGLSLLCTAAMADLYQAKEAVEEKAFDKAFKEFEQCAQVGNLEAQKTLGMLYLYGMGTEKNIFQAYGYFALAYEQSSSANTKEIMDGFAAKLTPAQMEQAELAWIDLYDRYGQEALQETLLPEKVKKPRLPRVPRRTNNEKRVAYGSEMSTYKSKLSSSLLEYDIAPDGRVRDVEIAYNLFTTESTLREEIRQTREYEYAANREERELYYGARTNWAQQTISRHYIQNQIPEFYRRLVKLEKAADEGVAWAQYELGLYIRAIPALERNKVKYAEYIRQAAESGFPQAMREYAVMLIQGDSVKPDYKEGIDYLIKAAQAGDATGQYKLARAILAGQLLKRDEAKALAWLEKAVANGSENARFWLARLYISIDDQSLRNLPRAAEIMDEVKLEKRDNPYWPYYMAQLKLQQSEQQDAIDYLDDALELAKGYHWDISQWQQEYDALKGKQS